MHRILHSTFLQKRLVGDAAERLICQMKKTRKLHIAGASNLVCCLISVTNEALSNDKISFSKELNPDTGDVSKARGWAYPQSETVQPTVLEFYKTASLTEILSGLLIFWTTASNFQNLFCKKKSRRKLGAAFNLAILLYIEAVHSCQWNVNTKAH